MVQNSHSYFYPVLDCVVGNLTSWPTRYEAARDFDELFAVLWKYPNMSDEDVLWRCVARKLAERYSVDVEDDLISELEHLKTIHAVQRLR